jgi:hypothetical protein
MADKATRGGAALAIQPSSIHRELGTLPSGQVEIMEIRAEVEGKSRTVIEFLFLLYR